MTDDDSERQRPCGEDLPLGPHGGIGALFRRELLALDVDDAEVMAEISHYFRDRFQIRSRVSRDEAHANLEQSIHYGERAVERDPEDLEAQFYLGRA